MSIDYNVQIHVGYTVPLSRVLQPFRERVEEVSHLEPRWDPQTGEKLEDEKIVDQETGVQYRLKGTVYDEVDLVEKLSILLGPEAFCELENTDQHPENLRIFFGISLRCNNDTYENHPLYCGGSLNWKDVQGCSKKLDSLFAKLKKFKIPTGRPKVYILPTIL